MNPEKNDQNQTLFINTKGGTRLLLPVLHGGSGIKTGGAHIYVFKICCSRIVCLQLTAVCCNRRVFTVHLTRHFFLVFVRTCNLMSHDIGSSVCARHLVHVSRECLISLRPSLYTLHLSLPSSTSSSCTLTSTFSSSMWMSSEQDPLCTSPNEESGPLANNAPLTHFR